MTSPNDEIELPEGRLALRVEEVAAALAISPWLVYQEIRAGRLPSVKIGRLVRVPIDGLRAYLDRSRDAAEHDGRGGPGKPKNGPAAAATSATARTARRPRTARGRPGRHL